MSECLSENEVLSLLRGTLVEGLRTSAEQHIDVCPVCQELFSCIARTAHEESRPRARSHADLPRGSKVGRYRLGKPLGAGAMGIVYLAEDPDLHRPVALKMLRRQDEQASDRLTREAQALARISHPNVIVVYEVGTFEDQIYMAMEFVQGESLTSWLQTPRSVSEILSTFEQVGRGLAVAHAAGLVHRDVKPDNVLVGVDGRVRVVDFGLARGDALLRAVSDESSRSLASVESSDAFRTLTRTGAFMGTPAYMAPEQYDGVEAEPRTDQFAFCVSLYEALYKKRPFEAHTLLELAQAVKAGPPVPPRGLGVPPRVESAISRGLSVRREDRFPSMEALLAELAPPATAAASRKMGLPAGLAIGTALLVAAGLAFFVRPPTPAIPPVASAAPPVIAAPTVATASPSHAITPEAEGVPNAPPAAASPRSAPRAPARGPLPKGIASTPAVAAGPLMPTTP